LVQEVLAGRLSRRGAFRVNRVAWTIYDLNGEDAPSPSEVDTAFRLRQGEPLLQAAVVRRAS
jgi:magnesium chelatase family protein